MAKNNNKRKAQQIVHRPSPVAEALPRVSFSTFDPSVAGIKENAFMLICDEAAQEYRFTFVVPDSVAVSNKRPSPEAIYYGLHMPRDEYHMPRDDARAASFEEKAERPALRLTVVFNARLDVVSRTLDRVMFVNAQAKTVNDLGRAIAAFDQREISSDHPEFMLVKGWQKFEQRLVHAFPGISRWADRNFPKPAEKMVALASVLANAQFGEWLATRAAPALYSAHMRDDGRQPKTHITADGRFIVPMPARHEDFQVPAYAIFSRPLREMLCFVNITQAVSFLRSGKAFHSLAQIGQYAELCNATAQNPVAVSALYRLYQGHNFDSCTDELLLPLFDMLATAPVENKALRAALEARLHNGASDALIAGILLHPGHKGSNKYRLKTCFDIASKKIESNAELAARCLKIAHKHGAPWVFQGWDEQADETALKIKPILGVDDTDKTIQGGPIAASTIDRLKHTIAIKLLENSAQNLVSLSTAKAFTLPIKKEMTPSRVIFERIVAALPPAVDNLILSVYESLPSATMAGKGFFSISAGLLNSQKMFINQESVDPQYECEVAIEDLCGYLADKEFRARYEAAKDDKGTKVIKYPQNRYMHDIDRANDYLMKRGLTRTIALFSMIRDEKDPYGNKKFAVKGVNDADCISRFQFADGTSLTFVSKPILSTQLYGRAHNDIARQVIAHFEGQDNDNKGAPCDAAAPTKAAKICAPAPD